MNFHLFPGQCFVPISDIQHLITFQFKSLLTQNVALTSKILPNLDEDDRLTRMLSELDKRYTGADYTEDKNRHVHMFRTWMKKSSCDL